MSQTSPHAIGVFQSWHNVIQPSAFKKKIGLTYFCTECKRLNVLLEYFDLVWRNTIWYWVNLREDYAYPHRTRNRKRDSQEIKSEWPIGNGIIRTMGEAILPSSKKYMLQCINNWTYFNFFFWWNWESCYYYLQTLVQTPCSFTQSEVEFPILGGDGLAPMQFGILDPYFFPPLRASVAHNLAQSILVCPQQ